jgi:peptidyl-prolyl cis-trans isomerase SurA
METFQKTLERDGVDFSKFREEIRAEMIMARLREKEVDNKLMITDAEVENYLNLQAKDKNEEYNLAHILITVPERATPEQIEAKRRRAEQALNELHNGASFAQVAAGFSDASNALQGGTLGWRSSEQLPTAFAETMRQLKIGQVTPVVQSANGFHIFKLLEKRGQSVPELVTQTHVRHILIKTNEVTSENEAKNRLMQIKERIDNGGNFADLAKANSEDMTAAKGGDLGWIYPGDTVPEFERAMDQLKPNQISEPIRSPFGWHLLQVLERRTQAVSTERQRILAREALRARKSEETYQEWQRQLRDSAYVEYRLEDR